MMIDQRREDDILEQTGPLELGVGGAVEVTIRVVFKAEADTLTAAEAMRRSAAVKATISGVI
jgi:hypothetical protein